MTSINNNIPANILSTTINTRAHITTTHAIRTMDIGYSVSQHCCCQLPDPTCLPRRRLSNRDAARVSGRKYSPLQLRWSTVDCSRRTWH